MKQKLLLNKSNFFYNLGLYLFIPIVGIWAAIRNFSCPESKIILIIFFGFFGMTMTFDEGKDGYRHTEKLKHYEYKDVKTFLKESRNILLLRPLENEESAGSDLYIHFISFFVAKWSTKSSSLFFIVGIIYGFFFISSIGKIWVELGIKTNFVLTILLVCFVLWKSLEGLNSIRSWTAGWVYFYGAFSFFQSNKNKYIILILLTPLIHFSFFLFIIPFFIVFVFGNNPKIYVLILVISIFYSAIEASVLKNLLFAFQLGESKSLYIEEGSSDAYLIERGAKSLHARYYTIAGKLFVSILFYYAILFFGYIFKNNNTKLQSSIASIGILTFAMSNFATFSNEIKERSFVLAGIFMIAYLLLVYSNIINEGIKKANLFGFNVLTILGLPFLGLFLVTQLSQIGEFTDLKVFVSPLLKPFFGDEPMLVKEFLRKLVS